MPRGAAAVVVLSLLCATGACAAKQSTPNAAAHATQARASSGSEASADTSKTDSKREMTWDEYYVDVEQRTRHAGGFVMWFNPPRLVRRSPNPNEPISNAPPPGNALDPAH